MKNKGFTLVELLAVISILAILVIISIPNVIQLFRQTQQSSFENELKTIYREANQEWVLDSMFESSEAVYMSCSNCSGKKLSLDGRSNIDYYVKINKEGKITKFYATDGNYQYSYDGNSLDLQSIGGVQRVSELEEENILEITEEAFSNNVYFCVDDGEEIMDFQFEAGMNFREYIDSEYNTFLDEYHPYGTPNGTVSTIDGGSSWCGTDMKGIGGSSNILVNSIIQDKSHGCYVYRDAGIC